MYTIGDRVWVISLQRKGTVVWVSEDRYTIALDNNRSVTVFEYDLLPLGA